MKGDYASAALILKINNENLDKGKWFLDKT
jgi:hypothetical protein